MDELAAYFRLGVGHILNAGAWDHILFIAALIAGETRHIKRLLILVTAFTVGHSLTLALAATGVVHVSARIVEPLIIVTIVVTMILNFVKGRRVEIAKYGLTLLFGLIHGLAFSETIAPMLAGGSIIVPLAGFNLGVEAGQLTVVGATVLLIWSLKHAKSFTDHRAGALS